MPTTSKLTRKQQRFCTAYAAHGNATQAARAAGYSRHSDDVLRQQGRENLTKPHIQSEIRRLLLEQVGTQDADIKQRLVQLIQGLDEKVLANGEIVTYRNSAVAARGIELWAKLVGGFVPERQEIGVQQLPAEMIAARHARMGEIFAAWRTEPLEPDAEGS